MGKILTQLLQAIPVDEIVAIHGNTDIAITSPIVEVDSEVQTGGIFLARFGQSFDGHSLIPSALKHGAVAIIGEKAIDNLPVPYVQVQHAQQVLGYLSSAWHDFPSRQLTVIGITGTDGKTTTSHLLHHILKLATNAKTGFISTIAADFGGRSISTGLHVTTPSAPYVQAYLSQMVEAGLTHCILEMTSHGLAQGRLNGVDLDVAVLTNVMHEHLDFHGSWEAYRDAKATMFQMLQHSVRKNNQAKLSILNADDGSFDYFRQIPADEIVSYGIDKQADFQATNIHYDTNGTHFQVDGHEVNLNLVGEFNVHNSLATIAAARALGVDWDVIQKGLAEVKGVSGRMEQIDEGQDFLAIVDFAHTPNALKRALEAGKSMLPEGKKLIAVFGSAGLRDVEKRRLMSETAAQLADMTILTAEDPRTESLEDILQMMADGSIAQGGIEGETFIRIPDRGEALYQACQMAKAGDIVMACGKGHEQSMCFGIVEYDWDDRDALRTALRGKPLRTLPTAR